MYKAAVFLASLATLPAAAQAAVNISSSPTKNMVCSAGICAPTKKNSVLNTGELAAILASSDVEVRTGADAATIELTAPLAWSSAHKLTLDATLNVSIKAPMAVEGTGGLAVVTNDGGTGGDLLFFPGGKVDFWDNASSLVVKGQSYVLVRDLASLAAAVHANPFGFFALAADYDASPDGTYSTAAIPSSLQDGVVEGLGHTISNLHVHGSGMFNQVFRAALRDMNLADVDVFGGCGGALAGVVGNGSVINVASSGSVSGGDCNVGGLIGQTAGSSSSVTRSASSATVTAVGGNVGGLIGWAEGAVSLSHAAGTVTAGKQSSAGGLVGLSRAAILQSYATGSVATHARAVAGGLVGETNSEMGEVDNSYSTGTVAAGSTGALGGLIGVDTVSVSDSYSTSHVVFRGNAPAKVPHVGAFIGSYGFGVLFDNYWDRDTSGQTRACHDGCKGGVTGLSDAQLKAGLPAGFDPAVWGQSSSINAGYPYLLNNPPE